MQNSAVAHWHSSILAQRYCLDQSNSPALAVSNVFPNLNVNLLVAPHLLYNFTNFHYLILEKSTFVILHKDFKQIIQGVPKKTGIRFKGLDLKQEK